MLLGTCRISHSHISIYSFLATEFGCIRWYMAYKVSVDVDLHSVYAACFSRGPDEQWCAS